MSINVCNDRSMASITSLPSGVSGSSLVLISTVTASSSSTVEFTSGIDSTYKEYIIKMHDIHASNDNVSFVFNLRDGGSSYDATKTTTAFQASHNEGDSAASLDYRSSDDLAQSTGFQDLGRDGAMGTGNDECLAGTIHLFNPSNTTFVKHFISRVIFYHRDDYAIDFFVAGYANTTSAIDGIQFKMSSGNIDSGTFKLYGVV